MRFEDIKNILEQAGELESISSIYFEGGEPFLYYAILKEGVDLAYRMRYSVGIVSNAYWANSEDDARLFLEPFTGKVDDLTVSSDLFHYTEKMSAQSRFATQAAGDFGIPTGVITIAEGGFGESETVTGTLQPGEGQVMYRGRAAEKLVDPDSLKPWTGFNTCPYENLVDPGRVHVDPLGYVHICQGITLGNLFDTPLVEICQNFIPDKHPILEPLIAGGPTRLVEAFDLIHRPGLQATAYADACHLCYTARSQLRQRFPAELAPDQVYGHF